MYAEDTRAACARPDLGSGRKSETRHAAHPTTPRTFSQAHPRLEVGLCVGRPPLHQYGHDEAPPPETTSYELHRDAIQQLPSYRNMTALLKDPSPARNHEYPLVWYRNPAQQRPYANISSSSSRPHMILHLDRSRVAESCSRRVAHRAGGSAQSLALACSSLARSIAASSN